MLQKSPVWRVACLLLLLGVTAFSPADAPVITKKYPYQLHLACGDKTNQEIDKATFDSLIALPFCAKDSQHQVLPVQGFTLLYAERGLYQDSAGLPIIFTDYTSFPVEGNRISSKMVDMFKERSYKGDTVYIDEVKVLGHDQKSHPANGLRIIIR